MNTKSFDIYSTLYSLGKKHQPYLTTRAINLRMRCVTSWNLLRTVIVNINYGTVDVLLFLTVPCTLALNGRVGGSGGERGGGVIVLEN